MNKHQEALDRLHIFSYFGDDGADSFHHKQHDEDIETLQELVDKSTPKKPLEIIFNNFGMGERIGRCPNCKILVNQFQTHCKCDQKLDWNEE